MTPRDELQYATYWDILNYNKGFKNPSTWIQYAQKKGFKKIEAIQLDRCPDCGGGQSRKIGQYIYYSTLIRLRLCRNCGLIYADVILDKAVVQGHFEKAYKDEEYYRKKSKVLWQVAGLASRNIARRGKLIDVGGGTGELARKIAEIRPDVEITVCDLSRKACEHVRTQWGFKTVCCGLSELAGKGERYDLALLIDVLYYEPDLPKAWQALESLAEDGSIILRVPNKVFPMRFFSFVKMLALSREKQAMLDSIDFLNPEHIYVFSRGYLEKRLRDRGFRKVRFLPSRLLASSSRQRDFFNHIFYWTAMVIYFLSFGNVNITPSQLVIAQR